MAADNNEPHQGRKPITPLQQKRMQQCYDHATKLMGKDEYDFDYVCDLLTQCVSGDLTKEEYIDAFLRNLYKKYKDNKKGNSLSMITGVTARGGMRKAIQQKDWDNAIKKAVEMLKQNPWDTAALCGMASICEALAIDNGEIKWLFAAKTSSPNDADVNRQCALALARRRQYDQAVVCWKRVEQSRPGDEEAIREQGRLMLEKARSQVLQREQAEDAGTSGGGHAGADYTGDDDTSPEERIRRLIAADPANVANYRDLAKLYLGNDRFKEAEKVLARAVKLAEDDPDIRDLWEESRLRLLRQAMAKTEKQFKEHPSAELEQRYKALRKELAQLEVSYYQRQVQRAPNNLPLHYEFGVRLYGCGQFGEAIKEFQTAQADPRQRGVCMLYMAQCFTQIKQYGLARKNYAAAVDEIPDRDAVNLKKALYLAGKLALAMKDAEAAEKYLARLAQMDFGYKDIATLLEKIEEVRQNK